jgi:hypothetical protein
MSSYTSDYPSVDFDPAYKKFFEQFYATSDTADAHEKYITNFTKDATLIMASKKVVGSDRMCLYFSPDLNIVANRSSRNSGSAKGHVGKGREPRT